MKILIDTNIVLDVLLKRDSFYKSSLEILELAQKDGIDEFVSASAITDIYYIANKQLHNKEIVSELILNLLKIVHIAGINDEEINYALKLGWKDFEDAVQYSSATSIKADCIVTRNVLDYKYATIPVYEPKDALNIIKTSVKPNLKLV